MSECCCGSGYDFDAHYVCGLRETAFGALPVVSAVLSGKDTLGALKVRCGIQRMSYTVNPGLYIIGDADENSPVFVTANYKLSFDSLRKELGNMNAWILVLDTKGVNVWCAAGKGTFGTEELVSRIGKTNLAEHVKHNTLILPQLGASGVCAHEVTKRSGFRVVFGPVRAADLPAFVRNGYEADAEARTVTFPLKDRAVLTPVEFFPKFKVLLLILGAMFLLNLFVRHPFGLSDAILFLSAFLGGCVLVPILLPFLPFRAFSAKGYFLGAVFTAALLFLFPQNLFKSIGYLLLLPSVCAYCAMNFTGCSTYTSPSGVLKEMKKAIPIMLICGAAGIVLVLLGSFLSL